MRRDLIIHEEKYNGGRIAVGYCEYAETPRHDYNATHILGWSHKYNINDNDQTYDADLGSPEEIIEWLEKNNDIVHIEDIYVFDHGGVVLKRSRTCPWDSSYVGVQYMTKDDIRRIYGVKNVTKKLAEKARELFDAEYEAYKAFCEGDVYEYRIEYKGDTEYGGEYYDREECIEDAKYQIDQNNKWWEKYSKQEMIADIVSEHDEIITVKYIPKDFSEWELSAISNAGKSIEFNDGKIALKCGKSIPLCIEDPVIREHGDPDPWKAIKEMSRSMKCVDADGKETVLKSA